jgi:UDP-xylose/UDP-N-acetylglucosamine transporter B4
MAAYFVLMSILNNLAFSFNISQPMHMVLRSSNLMVTYVYKRFWVGDRYSWQQLLSVVLLTAGALCATLATRVGKDELRSVKLWDANAPRLHGFAERSHFQF